MSGAPEAATGQPGRRERKKQQTRRLIAETARELFLERGFEAVSVAEIADAADVAQQTVFNHFPTKEDLFYSRLEAFEEALLAAIRGRGQGETVLTAFGRFLLEQPGVVAMSKAGDARKATEMLHGITRVITESPALLARERLVFADYANALAALLAAETGLGPDAIEPHAVANALIGVHRSLIDYVRRRVLAGAGTPEISRDLPAQVEHALARLESGLGDYAVR